MPTSVTIPWGNAFRQYFDRNPVATAIGVSVTSGAATRAETTDWTFTTPTGKRARLENALATLTNLSATALNGDARSSVSATRGGNDRRVTRAELTHGLNGPPHVQPLGGEITLLAGDTVQGSTVSNNSAPNTDVRHETSAHITEFDA